jgi:hypothetical protein
MSAFLFCGPRRKLIAWLPQECFRYGPNAEQWLRKKAGRQDSNFLAALAPLREQMPFSGLR